MRARPRSLVAAAVGLAITVAGVVLPIGAASADSATGTIKSAGPITRVDVTNTLACQYDYKGVRQFYGSNSCYIAVSVDGKSWGYRNNFWTPVDQKLTGNGTRADPFAVTTRVTGGQLAITMIDTYAVGQGRADTELAVSDLSGRDREIGVYRFADCFLRGSDVGYNHYDPATNAPSCRQNPPGSAEAGQIESFIPATPGANWAVGSFREIFDIPQKNIPFPDQVLTSDRVDNGMGISWNANLAAGATQEFAWSNYFLDEDTDDAELTLSGRVRSSASGPAAGDPVVWTATLKNTGNVKLFDLAVSDDAGSQMSCAASSVAVGDTVECTSSKPSGLTQAELDSGVVKNTATVTGRTPKGNSVSYGPVDASVSVAGSAALTGSLSVDLDDSVRAGDTVSYTARVKNTGSLTVDRLAVNPTAGSVKQCDDAALAPGAARNCVIERTVSQADIDAGRMAMRVVVRGGAVGSPVQELTTVESDDALAQTATATVRTRSNASGTVDAGDELIYTTTVKNTGNTSLSALQVATSLGKPASCSVTEIAPGESATCSAEYEVTTADADAGKVKQVATATATTPSGATVTLGSDTVTDQVRADPSVSASIVSDAAAVPAVGDRIRYTATVTNTGTVTLSGVGLKPSSGKADACGVTTLPVGATTTCKVTGSALVQADIDRGSVPFTADVLGAAPSGESATLATVRHADPVPATMTAAVELATDADATLEVGSTITATTTVTNTGNVTIDDVRAVAGSAPADCAVKRLAPGASTTCVATHRVTQADVDRGTVTAEVVVSGTAPDETSRELGRAAHDDTVVAAPALAASISSDAAATPAVGDRVTWTIALENTGNVTLRDLVALAATCPAAALAPGGTTSCTIEQVVTQADVDRGSIAQAADLVATTPAGNTGVLARVEGSESIAATATVAVSSHTDASEQPAVGDEIADTVTVRNTGNVTVNGLSLSTDRGAVDACDASPLAPGESRDCIVRTTIAQPDVDAGGFDITVGAVASAPDGVQTVEDRTATTVAIPAVPGTSLALHAEIGEGLDAGSDVRLVVDLTNTGNVTLDTLALVDDARSGHARAAMECDGDPVAPGATVTCTVHRTVTQAEVDEGSFVSTVSGHVRTPAGEEIAVESVDIELAIDADPRGEVSLAVASGTDLVVGTPVPFVASVRNRGNVTLHDVAIDRLVEFGDAAARPECDVTQIAPGATALCGFERTLTQGDVDAGDVRESVAGRAALPSGEELTFGSAAAALTIPADVAGNATVRTDAEGDVRQGQVITFTTRVENTGTITLHDVQSIDRASGTEQACGPGQLLPGATLECIGTRTVSAADIAARKVHVDYDISVALPNGDRTSLTKASVELRTEEPRVLAFTGAAGVMTLIGVGAVLLAVGALLVLAGLRRRNRPVAQGVRGRRAAR